MKTLIFTFILIASTVCAEVAGASAWWINLGGGVGGAGEDLQDPISGSASLTYQFGKPLASLRAAGVGELFGDSLTDIGILVGLGTTTPKSLTSIAAGLAYAGKTQTRGGFLSQSTTERLFSTIGIPVEIQLFFRPFNNESEGIATARDFLSHLGFGIYGFANLNKKESFGGVTFCIQLGAFE